jgi:hypothetical protein
MGMFSDFSVTYKEETYHVTTVCNSTITDFRFEIGAETGNKIIRFTAIGKDGVVGFCRVTIPTGLMNYPCIILVGTEEIVPTLLDVSNQTNMYLYFTYIHGSHTIAIISSKTLILYYELQKSYRGLNSSHHSLINNYSILLSNYVQLQDSYSELQIGLYNLTATYYDLINNYSILLGSYSQLQENYRELSNSYQEHLLDYSKNVHNIRSLMYIFAVATAIFITTTIYLSKRVHEARYKVR